MENKLPDDCIGIERAVKTFYEDVKKLNSGAIAYKFNLKVHSPEDVQDTLVHKYGIDKEGLNTTMASAKGHPEDDVDVLEASEKVADAALENLKQAQPSKEAPVGKEWIAQGWDYIRTKLRDMVDLAVNSIPKGANENLLKQLRTTANEKNYIEVGEGSGVFVGAMEGRSSEAKVEELYKKIKQSNPNVIGAKEFREGLLMRAFMRGKDVESEIRSARQYISENIDAKPILKQVSRLLDITESMYKLPGVEDFIQEDYKSLDVIKNHFGFENSDYYHNIIAMKDHKDGWDKLFFGDTLNISNFGEAKKYDSGLEAMLKGGIMPASTDYNLIKSSYLKSVANALRFKKMSEDIKKNSLLPNSSEEKMMISTHADRADPAFVVKDFKSDAKFERPQDINGHYYKDMGNLRNDFEGIYAHPDVYRWHEAVFRQPHPNGVVKAFLRGNGLAKSVVLSGGIMYHGGALGRKALYLGSTHGIDNFWRLDTIVGEGLSTAAKGKDFPILLDLVRNNFSLDQHDLLRNAALTRNYNMKTGELTTVSKLSEGIEKFTGWSHRLLFQKWQPGIKIGVAVRLVKSDWFANLVKEKGGDRDAALQVVSKICNDTFGGQNLEAIGRSRLAQTFLQACLLAPDWQESKMKRLFGTVLAQDSSVRKSFQMALMAEAATVIFSKVVLQQVYSATTGDERTLTQMFDDIMNRKIASIYIGKNPDGTEKHLHFGGSENQDFGPVIAIMKGLYETGTGEDLLGLPRELGIEARHKLAPLTKMVADLSEKKKITKKGPSQFDYPVLPIGVQDPLFVLRGGTGEKTEDAAATQAGINFISQAAGTPIQSYAVKKEKGKPKKKIELFK
jgi:hypothetical protein